MRVFSRNGMAMKDTVGREMHEEEGYNAIRYQWAMEINLDKSPDVSAWPDGIELRPFNLEAHNYSLHRAHEEAFGDLWDRHPHTYEDRQHRMTGREDFDHNGTLHGMVTRSPRIRAAVIARVWDM